MEQREENQNFPQVIAAPEDGKVRTRAEIPQEEEMDFTRVRKGQVDGGPERLQLWNDEISGWSEVTRWNH